MPPDSCTQHVNKHGLMNNKIINDKHSHFRKNRWRFMSALRFLLSYFHEHIPSHCYWESCPVADQIHIEMLHVRVLISLSKKIPENQDSANRMPTHRHRSDVSWQQMPDFIRYSTACLRSQQWKYKRFTQLVFVWCYCPFLCTGYQ